MKDCQRRLCRLDEVPSGSCREFHLGSGDWPLRGFVVSLARGEVRAYLNRCAHLSYPLNYLPNEFLSYDRRMIVCAMHGALFEKHNGLCVAGPCLGRSLIALPVQISAGCVWLADEVDLTAHQLNASGDSNKSRPSKPPASG